MKWKQFLTPVKSYNAAEAEKYISERSRDELTILDVRQPVEYEIGHIPGSKLLPLPDLMERIDEIDSEKPVVVYCAIGGRSRVAAQMLAGKGYKEIYNLSGGFRAWESKAAYGDITQGTDIFSADNTLEKTLTTAYSLEAGLRDFYILMSRNVKNEKTRDLFIKLSAIESKHQDRIYNEYVAISGKPADRDEFEKTQVSRTLEGGLTTEEYIHFFKPDMESETDVIELAMSIEAQALDLYMRGANHCNNPKSEKALIRLADEEQTHLKLLGRLIDQIHS